MYIVFATNVQDEGILFLDHFPLQTWSDRDGQTRFSG